MTAHCWRCGTETPNENLDAKPIWTLGLWVVLMLLGQRRALQVAADHGHDFIRLECGACYGPGYEVTP